MVEGITVVILAMIFLDLEDCCDTLFTKGRLIPSGATGNNTRHQARFISLDNVAQLLG